MEGTVNKNIYADYKGKRVYFCCPPCLKAFKKDPRPYDEETRRPGRGAGEGPRAENAVTRIDKTSLIYGVATTLLEPKD